MSTILLGTEMEPVCLPLGTAQGLPAKEPEGAQVRSLCTFLSKAAELVNLVTITAVILRRVYR